MDDIKNYIYLLFNLYEKECHEYEKEYSFDKWYKLYYTSVAYDYEELSNPDEEVKAYFKKTFKLLDEVGEYLDINWNK